MGRQTGAEDFGTRGLEDSTKEGVYPKNDKLGKTFSKNIKRERQFKIVEKKNKGQITR